MRMVFCTCPADEAEKIADYVVINKLVACVNVIPQVRSKYWWEGKICNDDESLLIMKTKDELVDELITAVKSVHSYTVPEIISFEIKEGNPDYLKWIEETTK